MAQDGGGEVVTALFSVSKYEYKDKFVNTKWAIAGAAIATDLITPAGLGPAMPFRNLDCFAEAVSKRGAGFRDPDRVALIPGFAQVGRRNGVGSDERQPLVSYNWWALGDNASDGEIKEAPFNAAHFQPQIQTVAHRLNALDVQMAGTRRSMCAGFSSRSFFSFFIQIPRAVIPMLDVDIGYLEGSIERDSDSDEGTQNEQDQMERQEKKATKDTATETIKQGQAVPDAMP